MRVQGAWNGMTLENADAPPPVVGAGGGMKVAGGRQRGVLVAWIDPREGERAQRAGIRPGDAIVGVDEQKIGGLADLGAASKKVKPGEPLMIHILRQGQLMTTVLPAARRCPACRRR
jgi:S1-C subfamily serine protease